METFTYDLSTDVGKLRLLVQDNDMSAVGAVPMEQRSVAFSDEDLTAILTIEPNLYEAASLTLRAWAANKQLIVVGRKFARGEVDYGQIRTDLMKLADAYHERYVNTPADAVVEQTWTDFNADRIILNEWQRGAL